MPRLATGIVVFDLPATELPVEPPSVIAVAHFEVGQPSGNDGDERSIDPNEDS